MIFTPLTCNQINKLMLSQIVIKLVKYYSWEDAPMKRFRKTRQGSRIFVRRQCSGKYSDKGKLSVGRILTKKLSMKSSSGPPIQGIA